MTQVFSNGSSSSVNGNQINSDLIEQVTSRPDRNTNQGQEAVVSATSAEAAKAKPHRYHSSSCTSDPQCRR